ncbi:hypothetical protein OF83DRAFT_1275880 [Amylostereum chailletii]|nr:hypothetical protein OF83DRAFT_1275880 [Amylostereum chailletii]
MASTTAAPSKVSFTIRRPTPVSRATSTGADSDSSTFKIPALPAHLAASDSSTPGSPLRPSDNDAPSHKRPYVDAVDSSDEEDDGTQDELVTGFDQFGVQRLHEKKKPQGPLVIPALQNRDWRAIARARRGGAQRQHFVPDGARARTGADGSVGGLGTRDAINSGPQMQGLQVRKRVKLEPADMDVDGAPPAPPDDDEDEFGAALLRGMGRKEGQSASRKGRGPVEPWMPVARPALLGIGAKEREVFDDGSKSKRGKATRPERKYMPLVKREVGGGRKEEGERSGSGSRSRRGSHSPEPAKRGGHDKDRGSRDRDVERYREKAKDRDGRDRRDYDRDRDRDRNGGRDRDGRRDQRDDRRDYDRDDRRDRDRRREKERERSPRRNGTKERSRRDH